jgi:glycosyltransferase involved in cell wall biosynthesis
MLVSILITSYNLAPYLAIAIDSALNQTYHNTEVIVVDDGSTDDSPAIIACYGDRVIAAFKENGGQVSAVNRAFKESHGELVCLLDADDVFELTKVESVVEAANSQPAAYLVHHQLQLIDAAGNPLHAPFPRRVSNGDIRSRASHAGGFFFHAVSSGLAFRRAYLERLFPLPAACDVQIGTEHYSVSLEADTYLAGPAALLAPVAGINRPLARYRLLESSRSHSFGGPADKMARYAAEMQALSTVMRETFGQTVDLRLDHHLEYQLLRCAAGEVSRMRTAAHMLRLTGMPPGLRCREAVRVCANRGSARRS